MPAGYKQMNDEQTQNQSAKPQNEAAVAHKSGYFRWQGLLGFIVTLALILWLLFIFAGQIIKLGIERGGSWYWGAEVNVAAVEVNWIPFKIDIRDFEATDPQLPSHNFLAFKRASAGIDLFQALLGKTLIDELVIEQATLDQPRRAAGQVYFKGEGGFNALLPDVPETLVADGLQSLPSVDDLLQRSDLKTVKAGQQLQQTYQTEKAQLDALRKELPDQVKLDNYRQAVKKIIDSKIQSPAQLAGLKAELDTLKTQFKADKARLKQAKAQLSQSKDHMTKAIGELKAAPGQDMAELSQRYSLDQGGMKNITQLVLGPQAGEYYQLAMSVLQRVKPMLDKMNASQTAEPVAIPSRGRFIHFAEDHPLPDWLVEKAHIGISLSEGDFTLQITELTAQHWLRNRATELTLKSANVLSRGVLVLTGKVFIDQQQAVRSDADWTLDDVPLQNLSIRQDDKLELTLATAKLQLEGRYKYDRRQLDNNNRLTLSNSVFEGQGQNTFTRAVVEALAGVDKLALDISAKGEIQSPVFSIHSGLDQLIYQALKKRLSKALNKFKARAKAGLEQKMTQQLKLGEGQSEQLLALGNDFDQLDQVLEKLLKSQFNDKLKDKLKDKLFNKLFN